MAVVGPDGDDRKGFNLARERIKNSTDIPAEAFLTSFHKASKGLGSPHCRGVREETGLPPDAPPGVILGIVQVEEHQA